MLIQIINSVGKTTFWLILCSTFMGAFFAFLFNIYFEKRKQFKKNVHTLVECKYHLKALYNFQKQVEKHINSSMEYYAKQTEDKKSCDIEDMWKSVTPFYVTIKLPDLSKFSLSFLISERLGYEKYSDWILSQNAAFDSICFLLNQRNLLDGNEMIAQKKIKRGYASSSGGAGSDAVKILNDLTKHLIKQNKNAINDYKVMEKEFNVFILSYKRQSTFWKNFFNL